jgi:hypothetical protein
MINAKSLYEALTDVFDIGYTGDWEFDHAGEQSIVEVIERWAATQETPHQKAARLRNELSEIPLTGKYGNRLDRPFYGIHPDCQVEEVFEIIDASLLNNNLDNDFPDEVKHD